MFIFYSSEFKYIFALTHHNPFVQSSDNCRYGFLTLHYSSVQ